MSGKNCYEKEKVLLIAQQRDKYILFYLIKKRNLKKIFLFLIP
jgi:hypothetical protein